MIDFLYIKNVALIQEVEINFDMGLNILSGETGAGKSMIMDSINFMLGGRFGKDFVRNGEETALVEGMFHLKNKTDIATIKEMGIELDEDNSILISRNINILGKSQARINGKTVTIGMLKEISSFLVDFHGQHEHQSLLDYTKHIVLLDKFCGESIDILKHKLSEYIKKYKEISKTINDISGGEKDKETRLDFLIFQKNEIESATLIENEEETLVSRRNILLNSQKLMEDVSFALENLFLNKSEDLSARDSLSKASKHLGNMKKIDDTIEIFSQTLESISVQLEELSLDLISYNENLNHDPKELEQIEQRLTTVYALKKKYGASIKDVLNHLEAVSSQIDTISNSQEKIAELNMEKKKYSMEISKTCESLSTLRKENAQIIQEQISLALRDLEMKNAMFEIDISRKEAFGQSGFDKVEFMISPNLGEPLKPLAKIASGGEMSRVMLALKTILADADDIETFIFDEIDTGVSGRTAHRVGEKLSLISKKHQILCITHLPQIASMANSHFLIEKQTIENSTFTKVFLLDESQEIGELARLIGGANITEATKAAAKEMREMALEQFF